MPSPRNRRDLGGEFEQPTSVALVWGGPSGVPSPSGLRVARWPRRPTDVGLLPAMGLWSPSHGTSRGRGASELPVVESLAQRETATKMARWPARWSRGAGTVSLPGPVASRVRLVRGCSRGGGHRRRVRPRLATAVEGQSGRAWDLSAPWRGQRGGELTPSSLRRAPRGVAPAPDPPCVDVEEQVAERDQLWTALLALPGGPAPGGRPSPRRA